jgi:hypothetical protein
LKLLGKKLKKAGRTTIRFQNSRFQIPDFRFASTLPDSRLASRLSDSRLADSRLQI